MATVLIGDDDQFICKLVEFNLKQHNFTVILRHDGQEILDTALELIPDCIILDLMIPTKDGKTITSELRKDKRTMETPIIIITAKGQRRDKEELLQAGANKFFHKPFDPEELTNAVTELINSKSVSV